MKLCCLLLYFLALFVLARVFEAVAWYESGFLATQLVDPVALSFRKLRTILECRGLGHSGLPQKKDVRELVEKSGTARPLPTRGQGEADPGPSARGRPRIGGDTGTPPGSRRPGAGARRCRLLCGPVPGSGRGPERSVAAEGRSGP